MYFVVPSNRLGLARFFRTFVGALILAAMTCLAHGQSRPAPASAKAANASHTPQKQAPATDDAVIFVRPIYPDGANIGVAYNRRVSHAAAQADVRRLVAIGQWQLIGPVQISDESVHPERLKEYPPTTGVFFRVTHAPQVAENAPVLMPYLKAFQHLNQYEINFELDGLQPYLGVTRVENSVVSIQMVQGAGLYTFQVQVHNHKENIPVLENNGAAIDQTATVGNAPTSDSAANSQESLPQESRKNAPPRPNMLLIVTLALGAGTLVSGIIYFLMSRQPMR